jgi:hypothetical protein
MERKLKDPDAVLDYGLNWKREGDPWLADGEEIVTSEWIVPAGITKDSDSHTATVAIIWLSGGVLDALYTLTNRITTNQSRTDDRSIQIQIVNR